jgi:predicted phage tail protein
MITIICIKNPFAPYEGREIHKIAYQEGKPVSWYIDPYLTQYVPLDKLVIAVNSDEVTGDNILQDGDFVVISPYIGKGGHKNPLLIVVSVALSVAAMGLGATVAGVSSLASATGWAAIGGYLTAAAVMYLGGTLINRVFGTTKENSTSNPTYSWDGITTTSGQGNAIPITYGTVKTGGQTLNKFVMIDDDDQYLFWLLAAGEGYLDISDVQINANPISYYEHIYCDIRNGLYNQVRIQNFNDTVSTVSLNQELLDSGWRTYELTGNANQGIVVQVECTSGLYYAKDNGSLGEEWVKIKAQYCVTGTTNWVTFIDSGGEPHLDKNKWWEGETSDPSSSGLYNGKISAAQTSAVRRQFRIDGLPSGAYTVRVMVIGRGADVGSTRAQTRIWWTSVAGVVYDDFSYPGMGLVGIKGLATNQLSGSPSITFIKKRTTILAYNPDTQVYETKDATNPAWAAYDMLHRAIDINGDQSEIVVTGVPADLILYDRFAAWAAFCDSKNLKINIEINTAEKMMESINKNIAAVGYGIVLMFGVKFGCVWDAVVDTPVQMFGMGNIIAGTFEEKFLQTSDRANAVEVTFTNKDKNYERDTVTVYADDYDDADAYNKSTSITMDGITSYEQAYRYGKFQLYCNKYLIRTCVFDAAIDAIACNAGDVIAVSHDVPEWACSGRITAVNGSQVTVGALFDNYDSTARYQFQYRASVSDNIHVVPISDMVIHDTGVTVTLSSVPSDAPAVGDVCDIAKTTIGSKLFTVKTITRSNDGEFKRTITCLEYNKNVFSENYDIPDVDYTTAQSNQAENIINVSAKQIHWLASDGTKHAHLYATWQLPDGAYSSKFVVYASTDNVNWNQMMETGGMACDFDTDPDTIYYLKIKTITNVSQSSGVTVTVDVGEDAPPNDVPGLTATKITSNTTQVKLSWAANTDIDLKGYRVYVNGVLHSNILTDTTYTYTADQSGQYTFAVVAVDNSDNESANQATVTDVITCEPADVTGFTVQQSDADRSIAVFNWAANKEVDLSYYEIRVGDTWDTGIVLVTKTKATTARYTLPASGSYTFWIKASNAEGFYSANAAQLAEQVTLEPDAVTSLAMTQSTQDKSKATLSWTAPSGGDIAYYAVKYGTSWDAGTLVAKTKEIKLTVALPGNGTWHYMVQAVTVAGYTSTIASTDITASIQPLDVTNFKAIQSATDRTRITLTWDAPAEVDVAYYIIKEGSNWDSAVIVSPRVAGTLYDVVVDDEAQHTWLIKAVTIAGNESQYAASVSGIYDLRPNPVASIQASQDSNNRSILNINWAEVTDGDLSGYQVKIGDNWDAGEPLPFTRELYATYTLTASGTFKVMIKAMNAAGYYSDEVSIACTVQVEPSNVTGLVAYQNGDTVELYWDKSPDNDVTGYEIREGYSFDSGALVSTVVANTDYTMAIDTARFYHYFVKAINSSGKYSKTAASVSLTVSNLSPRNVIQTFDEIALASGTHDNTEFGTSLINFQTIGGKWSDYPTTKFSEVGGSSVLKLAKDSNGNYATSGIYTSAVIDIASIITCNVTTLVHIFGQFKRRQCSTASAYFAGWDDMAGLGRI